MPFTTVERAFWKYFFFLSVVAQHIEYKIVDQDVHISLGALYSLLKNKYSVRKTGNGILPVGS